MFSIYSTAFNVIKNNFDYKDAVHNFCSFATEVTISINESEDATWDVFDELTKQYGNLKIIPANVSYDDARLDGKLFDIALQATTEEFKILLGLDQRIPLRQRENWEQAAYALRFSNFDAYLIPVIDLWGDKKRMRWDDQGDIKFQWFLHRGGLQRGVVDFAELADGKYDPSKSDSSELIYPDRTLVKAAHYLEGRPQDLESYLDILKNQEVYVFHMGYMNFENRIKVNKNIWQKQWEEIRGSSGTVPLTVEELDHYETFEHNLELWNE